MDPALFSNAELDQIRRELQRSGYPLEHRVASICQSALNVTSEYGKGPFTYTEDGVFRQEPDGTLTPVVKRYEHYPNWPGDNTTSSSQRLIYRDDRAGQQQQSVWREIDQKLEMETYTQLGAGPEDATIVLSCQALIECKHREDVMLVGFIDPHPYTTPSFPILGPLAHTSLISSLASKQPMPCQNLPRVTVGAVQNRKAGQQRKPAAEPHNGTRSDSSEPRKEKGSDWHIFDENLIYKAAGSLYDYLVTEWEPWAKHEIHPFLKDQGIMAMIDAAQSDPFFTIHGWMQHAIQPGWIEGFNATYHWNILSSLVLTLPIICVDMPLMLATVDAYGEIGPLEPTDAFIADERVHAWPGQAKHVLAAGRSYGRVGAPVVVVHVDALMGMLIELAAWSTRWHDALSDEDLDPQLVERWPLEEAILRATTSRE